MHHFSYIGKPENVIKAVENFRDSQKSIHMKRLFDDLSPHLLALLRENFSDRPEIPEPIVEIDFSTNGSSDGNGKRTCNSISLTIKADYNKQVV